MAKWIASICACLVLGLVAVGCGGDDDEGSSGSAETTQVEEAVTEAKDTVTAKDPTGAPIEVEIVDIDYEPRDEKVPKGATVKWTNTGNLPHTVTKEEGPGPDFDSGTLQPGETFEQTFDVPGEIAYHCTIHSQQRGSVTVQ